MSAKKTSTVQSLNELLKSGWEALVEQIKEHSKIAGSIKTKQDKFKQNHKPAGKAVAAAQQLYAQRVDKGELPTGVPFRDFFKKETGDFPHGKAEQCARVFLGLVVTKKLKERDYDVVHTDWLLTASTILGAINGDQNHAAIVQLVEILSTREENGAKQLRELKNEVKGKVQTPGKSDAEELTPELFQNILRMGFSRGYHTFVVAETVAEIHHIAERKGDAAKVLYQGTYDLVDAWEKSGITDQHLIDWTDERDRRQNMGKPMKKVTADSPEAPSEKAA